MVKTGPAKTRQARLLATAMLIALECSMHVLCRSTSRVSQNKSQHIYSRKVPGGTFTSTTYFIVPPKPKILYEPLLNAMPAVVVLRPCVLLELAQVPLCRAYIVF